MVQAVIFDLDGVLVDSEEFSMEATEQMLKELGIELTLEERERAFGRTDLDSYRECIKDRKLSLNPEDMVRRKEEIYSKLISGKLKPIEGAAELIQSLGEKAVRMAVASSGTRNKIRASLREIGFEGLFETVVSAEDITQGKPNPEIFLKAAERLGVPPAQCLVIEDAQAGVEAAKAAGMKCLAFKSPNTHGQDLSKADKTIDSLKQAEDFI